MLGSILSTIRRVMVTMIVPEIAFRFGCLCSGTYNSSMVMSIRKAVTLTASLACMDRFRVKIAYGEPFSLVRTSRVLFAL